MNIDAVIKVGGSLIKEEYLEGVLKQIESLSNSFNLVIVIGGGSLADNVRVFDNKYNLSDSAAHWSAIKTMDTNGDMVADISEKLTTVRTKEDVKNELSENKIPVFKTYRFMQNLDETPESWDITSDSISGLVARELTAEKLILVKMVDGIEENGDLLKNLKVKQLENYEVSCIDPYLKNILEKDHRDCIILSGKHPQRIHKTLKNEEARSTYIN